MELPCLPLIQERFWNEIKDDLAKDKIRYPEFEMYMFPQVWASTALGFDGIGGRAITSAYTTNIHEQSTGWCGVFFGERLAYKIKDPNGLFFEDEMHGRMAKKTMSGKYKRNENALCGAGKVAATEANMDTLAPAT